jgi:hypothetical protein
MSSHYIEANKKHVKDRLTEIYRRPGIVERFLIRDISDEDTDFRQWAQRLFTPAEIDQIIIQSNLIMVKQGATT